MKISVIVPAFNEEKLIAHSLRSMNKALGVLARRGWGTELVVCDNNSNDRTAALAREQGAKVVFEPVNQIGRARNTGASAASGDWLVFVDADSQPSPALFADVAEVIAGGRCLAGGSTVRLDGDYFWGGLITGAWNILSRVQKWAPGSFIFCDAAAFRQLGGFNQELYASEELDLFQRLKRLANESGRDIVILHRHPLLTSARKLHLYTAREHLLFLGKTVWGRGQNLKDPKQCYTWYDGRR
jgi:glycosyltransferase involved in cell wall biosynthesis